MEDDDLEICNEDFVVESPLTKIRNIVNVSKGTGKIEYQVNGDNHFSSCFLLKFERNNGKPFFCIMTNAHAINSEIIEKEKEIKIRYDNEQKDLLIKLSKQERIMLNFMEQNIDIMIIEIIPKDDIDKTDKTKYFLIPKSNIKEESLLNKDIQIIQFPNGEDLSCSKGKITKIVNVNKHPSMFFHEASTLPGSSGSPIVLEKEEEVIGIHKGSLKDNGKNIGLFIGRVVDKIKNYKRNGTYKEFYENGELKYEGKFLDDEYNDDNGKYIDEQGYTYQGKFEKGKKNGKFKRSKNGKEIECEFKDDERIDDNKDEPVIEKKSNIGGVDFWQNIGMDIFHYLKPLGDDINFNCLGCPHVSKYHTEIRRGVWVCSKCPKDDNICKFNDSV